MPLRRFTRDIGEGKVRGARNVFDMSPGQWARCLYADGIWREWRVSRFELQALEVTGNSLDEIAKEIQALRDTGDLEEPCMVLVHPALSSDKQVVFWMWQGPANVYPPKELQEPVHYARMSAEQSVKWQMKRASKKAVYLGKTLTQLAVEDIQRIEDEFFLNSMAEAVKEG